MIEDNEEFKKEAEKYIALEIPKPHIFDDENEENIIIRMQRDFMLMTVSLEEKGINNVENISVMKYFAALDKARQEQAKMEESKQKLKN